MRTLSGRIPYAAVATVILAALLAFLAGICCQTTYPACSRSDTADIELGRVCTADLLADGSAQDRLPEPPLVDRVGPSPPAPAMRVPAETASPNSLPSTLRAVDSPLLC